MILISLLMCVCGVNYERFRVCQRIYDYIYDLVGIKFSRISDEIQAGYLDCPSCGFPIHCIICGSLMEPRGSEHYAVCSNEDCRFGEDGLPEWLRH